MPKIINLSMEEVRTGEHLPLGDDAVLIQISDHDIEPPISKQKFAKTFEFRFLDVEDQHECKDEYRISQKQADEIISILKMALEENRDVLVHCYAGVSRSGAIAEVAIEMGFEDCEYYRDPNSRVLRLLRNSLNPESEIKPVVKEHNDTAICVDFTKRDLSKFCMSKNEILGWRIAFAIAIIWCAYFSYVKLHH